MKKLQKTMSACLAMALSVSGFAACGVQEVGVVEKDDVSYLYVNTRDDGFGVRWLKAIETEFEAAYANESFAEGKTGVDLVISASANLTGGEYINNIASSNFNVSFVAGLYYFDYLAKDLLYDLTDVVKAELPDGSGTIENKLFDDQVETFSAVGGKYYSLPSFVSFPGVTYDAQLFEDNFLYFADEGGVMPVGNSSYTGTTYTGRGIDATGAAKRSPGPDGKYDSYDDGLPSSYEEYFYLLDTMVEMSITPFVWTGRSQHYTNMFFFSLLNSASTKEEFLSNFTFDSGEETVDVITGFNGTEPNVDQVKITADNGYLTTQTASRYQALKFLEHFYNKKNKYYDSRCESSSLSNTQAQKVYEESSLDPLSQDIAMMIEGTYWYDEAASELEESIGKYGEEARNRDLRYMPLPAIETGTVNEGEGKSIILSDSFYRYLCVNNNIKNDAEKVKLAETFVKFVYHDSSLQLITTTASNPWAVKYEITPSQYAGMDNYAQSVWDVYDFAKDNDTYVTPMSANSIFMDHTDKFTFSTTSKFCTSYVNGMEYSYPVTTFWDKKADAKSYFEGMKITQDDWTKNYNK